MLALRRVRPGVPESTAAVPRTELFFEVSTKEIDPVGAAMPGAFNMPDVVAISV